MSKQALIIGANGRMGRAASKAFIEAGWRVRTLARRHLQFSAPDIEQRHGDATDAVIMRDAAKGMDVIVNAVNAPYGQWRTLIPALTESTIKAARSSGATLMLPGNVYGFGHDMPPILKRDTPTAPQGELAELRVWMEERYSAAQAEGVRSIVVRAGDFIEGRKSGNWFEDHIVRQLGSGRMSYPGPLDRAHAWAWLPDLARAMAAIADNRASLEAFAIIGFPGWTLTGQELQSQLSKLTNVDLRIGAIPWPMMRLMSVFSPTLRGVCAMRYLWHRPHQIDGSDLAALLPDFERTSPRDGLRMAIQHIGGFGQGH